MEKGLQDDKGVYYASLPKDKNNNNTVFRHLDEHNLFFWIICEINQLLTV